MWRLPSIRPATHQDVFLQRYSWLLSQALWLTGHDRDLSEDLVQEAFVQFALRAPDLDTIESLDAYLYVMIRNLRLSRLRRAGRERTCSLSTFDPDTAPDLPRAPSVHMGLVISEDLWRVCDWACRRKETSKAGSVLLLRFVHGYEPREIALIMRSPARAVDDWLRLARREASLEIGEALGPAGSSFHSTPPGDIVSTLRGRVFAAQQTPCPSYATLHGLYHDADARSVSSTVLAHIVSCPTCLDAVNQLLKLRPRSQRDPRDMLGPHDRGPRGSGRLTRGPGHDLRSRLRRRLQGVVQHRPSELRVAVNGFVVGAQRVNSERSEQTIAVNIEEPIGFVEVFSEDDVRLVYCDITPPPDGDVSHSARVGLSGGRSLSVTVDFAGPWPTLHVTYLDPGYASQTIAAPAGSDGLQTLAMPGFKRARAWDWVFGGAFARPALFRTAAAVGCLLLAVAIVGIFTSRTLTAAELLRQSRLAEERYLTKAGVVTHRVLHLVELDPSTRRSLARHRIDMWREGTTGRQVRRYYAGGERLVAGEWIQTGGGRSVYSARLPVSHNDLAPAAALTSGQAWRLDLSTGALANLLRPEAGTVTRQGDRFVLSFGSAAITGAPDVEQITLSLEGAERHLVEATFLVRQDGRLRLFSIAEHRVERVSSASVSPDVFNPDAELLPSPTSLPPATPRVRSANELLNLEVDAYWRLDAAGATLGEQVMVKTNPDGLRIEGVVDTPQRKRQLEATLGQLASHPAVRIDLRTAAEALGSAPHSGSPVVVHDFAVTSARVPAYAQLRRFLMDQPDSPAETEIDARVEEMAIRLLERARRTLHHARAVDRLSARVSPEAAGRLDSSRRERWRTMLVRHLAAVAAGSFALENDLRPILFGSDAIVPRVAPQAFNGDFRDGIGRLNDLTTHEDRLLRELLTVSDHPIDGLPEAVRGLREALRQVRDLAEQLRARADQF